MSSFLFSFIRTELQDVTFKRILTPTSLRTSNNKERIAGSKSILI